MARKREHRETETQVVKSSQNSGCKRRKTETKEIKKGIDPTAKKINTVEKGTQNVSDNDSLHNPEKTTEEVESQSQSSKKNEIVSTPGLTRLTKEKDKEVDNSQPQPKRRGRPSKKIIGNSIEIIDGTDPKSSNRRDIESDDKACSEKETGPRKFGKAENRKRGRPKKNVEDSIVIEDDTDDKFVKKSNNETDDKNTADKRLSETEVSRPEQRRRGRASKKEVEKSVEEHAQKPVEVKDDSTGKSKNEDEKVTEKQPVVMTLTLEHLREMRRSSKLTTVDKSVKGKESSRSKSGKEDSNINRSVQNEEKVVADDSGQENIEKDNSENQVEPVDRTLTLTSDNLDKGRRSGRVRKLTDKAAAAKDSFKIQTKSARQSVDQESHVKETSEETSEGNKGNRHVSANVQDKLRARLQKGNNSQNMKNKSPTNLSAKGQDRQKERVQKGKDDSSTENTTSSGLSDKVKGRPKKDKNNSTIENKNNSSSHSSTKVQDKGRGKFQKDKEALSIKNKNNSSSKQGIVESPSKIAYNDHSFCKIDSNLVSKDVSRTENAQEDDIEDQEDDIEDQKDDIEGHNDDIEMLKDSIEAKGGHIKGKDDKQTNRNAGPISGKKLSSPCPVSLHLNDHVKKVGNNIKLDASVSEKSADEMEQTTNPDLPKDADDLDLSRNDPKESPPATTIDLNSMLTMAESDEKVLGGVSALIKDSLLQINGMRQFVIHDLPSLTNITCFQTADKIAISGTIQGVNRAWSILTNIERNVHSKDVQNKKAVRIQWKTKSGLERVVEFKRVSESHHYKKSASKFVKPVTVFVDVKTPVAVNEQQSDTENESVNKSVENIQNKERTSIIQQSPEPPKVSLLGKPFSRIQIEGQVGIPVSKRQSGESHNYATNSNASSPTYKITVNKSSTGKSPTKGQARSDKGKDVEQGSGGQQDEVNDSAIQDESYDDFMDDMDASEDGENIEGENGETVIWEGKVETVDNEKHVCEHCSESFDSKNQLLAHIFYQHEDDDGEIPAFVECDSCSQRFRCRMELHKHKRRAHSLVSLLPNSNKGSHVCNVCQKSFTEKRYLTTHLKRHTGVKNHKCDVCGWRFFEAHKLKFHLETHKERSMRQLPYRCTICLRQYHNRQSWNDHMNTHTGSKPYKCQVCGSGFAHRIGLHRHKLIHEKDCPYKCTHCHRGFKVKANLTAHMTIHTGVGKHTCQQCKKVFTVATSLRRHRCQPPNPEPRQEVEDEVESEETYMFMCGVCSITFPTLQEAETHSLAHVDTPSESVNLEGLQVEEIANETDILATDPVEAGTTYYIHAQNSEDGTLTTTAYETTTSGLEGTQFQNTAHVSFASSASVDEVEQLQMAASTLADLSTLSKDTDLVVNSQPVQNVGFAGDTNSTKFVTMTTAGLMPEGQAEVVTHVAMAGSFGETMETTNPEHETANPEHISIATTNHDIVSMIATTGHDIVTMATASNEAIMTQAQTG